VGADFSAPLFPPPTASEGPPDFSDVIDIIDEDFLNGGGENEFKSEEDFCDIICDPERLRPDSDSGGSEDAEEY